MKDDKRLIEDYLPIEAISKEASREKSVRKGHISTLHLWWARRPLVACRAAVYGALVSASRFAWSNESKKGKRGSGKDLGRAEAEKFIERLCKYPGDERVIAEAQQHILEAHAERLSEELGEQITAKDIIEGRAPRPKVLDMFAGGGAIPLEALRLGCEAYALDLNPVAHIIELCTLVYPQKYGNPDLSARGMTGPKNAKRETTWGGLADEVRYWGNWVLERARNELGDLYPLIPDPKAKKRDLVPEKIARLFEDGGAQQKLKVPDGFLMPVAYLWTRTVPCKNPACAAVVPLVRQTWLCKKDGRCVALKLIAPKGKQRVSFRVVEASRERELGFDPEGFSRAGNATCPFCGTVADNDYIKAVGTRSGMGAQLMAVVATRSGEQGKVYLSPNDNLEIAQSADAIRSRVEALRDKNKVSLLLEPMPVQGTLGFRVQPYGLRTWGDLFTARQALCLMTFAAIVKQVGEQCADLGYRSDESRALQTCLAVLVDRLADFNSTGCTWNYTGGRGVLHTMARQALPMTWDYAETNPFNPKAASWISAVEDVPAGWRMLSSIPNNANVVRGTATQLTVDTGTIDAVITDPPYYDNVPYADISDFFYIWLKRTVGHLYPDHFSTELTPKKNEAIAEPVRHGGDIDKAKRAYEKMMAASFAEAHRVLKPGGPMIVVYAHKTTLGWATLVDALRHAGFTVSEAWPLDTERPGRLRAMDSAALASSIDLVARKRDGAKTGSYERDVQPLLEQIVRERVETLWKMRITGADLVIAAVGAGLRAFTQFARVEYENGDEVPSERFLAEVEGVVLETMLEKIFGVSRSGVAAVDGPSRFYVLWRYTYKAAELDAGEAIVFTYGQPVELDGQKGLSTGSRALLEKKKSKYRLYDFTERGDNDRLGLRDESGEAAPLMDVLHRVLWLMEYKPRALPSFLEEARPDSERLRLVAQALGGPALKGKADGDSKSLLSTTTAEQGALGKLLQNWRSLIDSRLGEFRLR